MEKINKELWLFSREPSGGGVNTVVETAKKLLVQVSIKYNHLWITDFSSKEKHLINRLYFRSLPLPVYLNNFLAGKKWKNNLKFFPSGLVLGGTPAAGGIPYAAGLNYGMWIGTSLRDELRSYGFSEAIINKDYSRILNKVFENINNIFEEMILKKAAFIIVQSRYLVKCIKDDYNIEDNKLYYLPFPISVKSNRPKAFNSKAPVLLAVGRVDDDRKNFSFLLKVFKVIRGIFPSIRLRIVGPVSPYSKIIKQSIENGIDSHIDFLGEISFQELRREYHNADIFVLTPKQEGLGIVFLEAMSYGLPVVTTKCGGPEGIIFDSFNGYLVDQNDLEAFVTAIDKLLTSDKQHKEIGEQAYQYIIDKHNPEKFKIDFLEIMRNRLEYKKS